MKQQPTVVIVQHVPHESCGWLAELLGDAGVAIDLRRMWASDAVPTTAEVDALVVLGGPMGAYDDAEAPWLPDVRGLLADAVARRTPTLALCLGAQLLAVATGGVVRRGGVGPELGLGTVTIAPDVTDDALFAGMLGDVDVVQWHWDEVATLPASATVLASSKAYPVQAFRVGDRAWGLQFHPEVTMPLVAQWAQNDREAVHAAGIDPPALVGAVADAERGLLEAWTPLLERFVALIRR